MKIKIQSSELAKYQREADSMMNWIDASYESLLQPVIDNTSTFKLLWKRFFTYPPSLRFYSIGESLTEDKETLRKAKIYRQAWHLYWSVKHQFNQITCEEDRIWLDSWETEVILSLRECMKEIKEFN